VSITASRDMTTGKLRCGRGRPISDIQGSQHAAVAVPVDAERWDLGGSSISAYAQRVRDLEVQLARLPEEICGSGHAKHANVVTVRAKQQSLLDPFHGKATTDQKRVRTLSVCPLPGAARSRAKSFSVF